MPTPKARSAWFPFDPKADSAVHLVCLPHPGAGASAYRAWGTGLPPDIAACPVQPPGRETRSREAPLDRVEPLVSALADDLLAVLDGPYALFGHSTGALCAFELCREVRRRRGQMPEHLLVAGRRAPQLPEEVTGLQDMTADEVVAVLRRHGGTPERVFAAPGMLDMIRPLLAADFAVSERYAFPPGTTAQCPDHRVRVHT